MQLCRYVKKTNNTNQLLKAAKAKHLWNKVKIKFGMQISCDPMEVMMFDSDNGNNNWKGD